MTGIEFSQIEAAEIVLPCGDLDATLRFFTEQLGFRLDLIFPADAPRVAVVSGGGSRIRLESGDERRPARIRLLCNDAERIEAAEPGMTAPNGTQIEWVPADPPVVLPPLSESLIVQKGAAGDVWGTGRAGMQYRDLIPGRLGGRFIASHIRIPEGGPVPDYVHHHHVRFQMIYCYRGWVKVVYEDQGPPFVMNAGDCVLQPPHIRHRVLECSDAFEVVEIGCPAEHETLVDHDMALPTATVDPGREFGSQRFVFHQAAAADWLPWRDAGFEARDTGIGGATDGVASVAVVRPSGPLPAKPVVHDAEFLFRFVLEGGITLHCDGLHELTAGDAFVIPAGSPYMLDEPSDGLQMLEVSLPAVYGNAV